MTELLSKQEMLSKQTPYSERLKRKLDTQKARVKQAYKCLLGKNGGEVHTGIPLVEHVKIKKPLTADQKLKVMLAQHKREMEELYHADDLHEEDDFTDDFDNDILTPYENKVKIIQLEDDYRHQQLEQTQQENPEKGKPEVSGETITPTISEPSPPEEQTT